MAASFGMSMNSFWLMNIPNEDLNDQLYEYQGIFKSGLIIQKSK